MSFDRIALGRIARGPIALLGWLVTVALSASHAGVCAAEPLPCSARQTGAGSGIVTCPIPSNTSLSFEASFAGVHDDSMAALALDIDGKPATCGPASQTRLEGETQGRALTCRFAAGDAGTATREARFRLAWHHAEAQSFLLVRQDQKR